MDRLWDYLERLSVLLIVFLFGCASAFFGLFPYEPYVRDALVGTSALTQNLMAQVSPIVDGDVWGNKSIWERDGEERGVTISRPGQLADGLILITVGQSAKLIAHDGSVVHEWAVDYDDLPDPGEKLTSSTNEDLLYWQRAVAMPDGDLVVMVNHNNMSPDGLALMRLDRNSRVKWVRYGHYHHDFDIAQDGTIQILWQAPIQDVPDAFPRMNAPVLDEGIATITPAGKETRRVSILSAFAKSDYSAMVRDLVPGTPSVFGDYMHNNNVEVVTAAIAATHTFARPGQVLISLREADTIALLDMGTGTITWAAHGPWHRQHDPDFLPNGHIMIFDNKGDWDADGRSRVIEYDPQSHAIVWQYPDGDEGTLWSSIRGEQQLLPNGNVLINEFGGRRLMEVTRDRQIVWEYRCPFTSPRDPDKLCTTMSSRAYNRSDLPFLGNEPLAVSSDRDSEEETKS